MKNFDKLLDNKCIYKQIFIWKKKKKLLTSMKQEGNYFVEA